VNTARRIADLGAEAFRIALGASAVMPDRKDRRFADPAWSDNWLLKRAVQLYLASGRTAEQLLNDADLGWRDEQRARFLLENLIDGLSPSNVPLVNPASAKAVIDTAGLSLLRGGTQLVKDLAAAPRIPEMVDLSGFEVGGNIAITPGSVVFRSQVLELIQYHPQTEEVYEVPVLIVPPTINKYYAIDLAPGRSLVEHSIRQGRQLFVISWRNPDGRHADWNFETYVTAILEALDAVERITGSPQTVLGGICSGGILASITAAYLAGIGKLDRVAALCLAVTVIDANRAGTASALSSRRAAEAAKAMSRRRGYLDGRALAEIFAWLRPGDLIWNYWVNNYLLGQKPPAFDILFWNSETTRMPAGLHADFVDMSLHNSLVTPGALEVKGVPIDLGSINVDAYVVAGIADHLTPWQNCYRTVHLLGGQTRFVLSSSGHIAALVNPPGNPKAAFYTNPESPASADEWLAGADTQQGTWWTDVTGWLNDRFGKQHPAPAEPGTQGLPALADAPGTYLHDS
jgi:polyhydroxyalkanoate synthase subunit PhaC